MLEVLTSLSCSSPSGPSPDMPFQRCTCDNCGWQYFTGTRYKCAVCEDYDLCSPCYDRNVHDLTHPFMRITKPGGKPTYLSARCKSSHSSSSSTTTIPATLQPSTASERVTSPSSPFFYHTMSTPELKAYLTDRGVEFSDVVDNKTLCRRVWDTHCDCMTLIELNTFCRTGTSAQSLVGMSTAGGRRLKNRLSHTPQGLHAHLRLSLGKMMWWFCQG